MRLPAPRHPLPCLLLCLALLPAVASAQTDEEKRAAMNAAYRQYQELIALGPQMRAQAEAPAREAYELALDVLGDAHATTAALASMPARAWLRSPPSATSLASQVSSMAIRSRGSWRR